MTAHQVQIRYKDLVFTRFRGVSIVVSLLMCCIWSYLYNRRSVMQVICKTGVFYNNYVPSISATTGDHAPQRYFWRIGVCLNVVERLWAELLVHLATKQRGARAGHGSWYARLNTLKTVLFYVEQAGLILLTYVSSRDHFPTHAVGFSTYGICQSLYIYLSLALFSWTRLSGESSVAEHKYHGRKVALAVVNQVCLFLGIYLYLRHEAYCEPGVYSLFGLTEYILVFSNIAFHYFAESHLEDYTLTITPANDIGKSNAQSHRQAGKLEKME